MTRSIIVDVTARVVLRATLLYSLYLLLAGHNQPGGGFVGGLVAGAAVAFAYVAGGVPGVRGLLRPQPWSILGAGLTVATVAALTPILLGGQLLESDVTKLDLPVAGAVKLSSTAVFDAGVYAVVVGLVLMLFEAFGEDQP